MSFPLQVVEGAARSLGPWLKRFGNRDCHVLFHVLPCQQWKLNWIGQKLHVSWLPGLIFSVAHTSTKKSSLIIFNQLVGFVVFRHSWRSDSAAFHRFGCPICGATAAPPAWRRWKWWIPLRPMVPMVPSQARRLAKKRWDKKDWCNFQMLRDLLNYFFTWVSLQCVQCWWPGPMIMATGPSCWLQRFPWALESPSCSMAFMKWFTTRPLRHAS